MSAQHISTVKNLDRDEFIHELQNTLIDINTYQGRLLYEAMELLECDQLQDHETINQLECRVDGLDEEISGLEHDLGEKEEVIKTLEIRLDKIQNKVDELNACIR